MAAIPAAPRTIRLDLNVMIALLPRNERSIYNGTVKKMGRKGQMRIENSLK
jgi:hypothetical protein